MCCRGRRGYVWLACSSCRMRVRRYLSSSPSNMYAGMSSTFSSFSAMSLGHRHLAFDEFIDLQGRQLYLLGKLTHGHAMILDALKHSFARRYGQV